MIQTIALILIFLLMSQVSLFQSKLYEMSSHFNRHRTGYLETLRTSLENWYHQNSHHLEKITGPIDVRSSLEAIGIKKKWMIEIYTSQQIKSGNLKYHDFFITFPQESASDLKTIQLFSGKDIQSKNYRITENKIDHMAQKFSQLFQNETRNILLPNSLYHLLNTCFQQHHLHNADCPLSSTEEVTQKMLELFSLDSYYFYNAWGIAIEPSLTLLDPNQAIYKLEIKTHTPWGDPMHSIALLAL